ncbi:hypothetical protein ACTJK4_17225 [Ralstonia sp. 22111]|uniref:hypothetical protein n=1 Tax=Ralstonia sp. 22111 TaxID=3453878 RepID=UPI003F83F2DB
MNDLPYLDFQQLENLASRSDSVKTPCECSKTSLAGWSSLPVSFPEEQLQRIGTLVQGNVDEATFAEFHPGGTGYWSDDAPIAPHYLPYNRSDVWECKACRRVFLRYTEGGGYFVDQRVRALTGSLLVDAALS